MIKVATNYNKNFSPYDADRLGVPLWEIRALVGISAKHRYWAGDKFYDLAPMTSDEAMKIAASLCEKKNGAITPGLVLYHVSTRGHSDYGGARRDFEFALLKDKWKGGLKTNHDSQS